MMEFLQFTFSGFWHFVGVCFMMGIVSSALASVALILRRGK